MGEIFRKVMVKVMKIDLRAERARKRAQEGSEVAEENDSEETEASLRNSRTLGLFNISVAQGTLKKEGGSLGKARPPPTPVPASETKPS